MDEPNPPKKRGCFFFGCLFSVLGGLAFAGLIAGLFFYGKASVEPTANDFLAHIDQNEYAEAYAMMSEGWKKESSLEQFTGIEKKAQATLGSCQSKTMTSVKVNSNNGVTTSQLEYTAQFAKGSARLNFNLIKEGGVWKINDVEYISPLLKSKRAPDSPEKPDPDSSDAAPEKSETSDSSTKEDRSKITHGLNGAVTNVGKAASTETAANEKVDVVLTGIGPTSKIQVIKVVRELTSLGLKEAKDLVESAPKTVKSGVARDEAEKMKAKLEAAGGVVELK